ncbi:MAG TPA: Lrp/AsnC family transcriptional regulator [Sphingomicrobium sp.]|nr:Lrp/AsnC family transcriptional regulator [Sphingomicrobium sp.]
MSVTQTNILPGEGGAAARLDAFDRRILGALKLDSRMSYAELGRQVHLSAPAVYERVRKLRESGIIRSYTVETDPRALGLNTGAYLFLSLSGRACREFAAALVKRKGVEECHAVTGDWDLIARVLVGTPGDLEDIIAELASDPNVAKISSSLLLRSYEAVADR